MKAIRYFLEDLEIRPGLKFDFKKPFPESFDSQDDFEDFILDEDKNNVFGELKYLIAEEEGYDIEDEREEQDANEDVWQEIYKHFKTSYESHY